MTRRGISGRKIRYAVVGLGHLAQVAVLPAFRSAGNSELFALVSGDPDKLEKLGKKYSLDHLYSDQDYSRALSNVDAVYLAVPNHLHREYAVRASAAGVHVLCEKPMAVSSEDCEAMIAAAKQNHAKLMIAYRLHFEAANLEAVELARSGKLGDLRIFTSEFAQQVARDNIRVTEPVARGGGAVYDMGVYCINASRYLFGEEPVEVMATAGNDGDERFKLVEEMMSVVMRFPEGRLGSFTCSFGAADIGRYTLIGTKGVLRADPAYEYAMALKRQVTIGEKTTSKTYAKRDQFAAQIFYFSDCILKDKEPEPSGLEGLADVRIVEAICESARTRRPVRVPEIPGKRRPTLSQEIHRPAHGKPQVIHAKPPSREAA
ncbi:MAG TPA: Gfo/Idh/MocA family oxidoreductase [Candidatus Sulfotelmatobacter sp.]|nr:Gfo/Idh/MocA family oxidoreductase [Candidatus Sulfotelmatobacter sp.]